MNDDRTNKFKEALHSHFDEFPIGTQLGVLAIMKHIDKVFAQFESSAAIRDESDKAKQVAGELYRVSTDTRYASNRRAMFEAILTREYGNEIMTSNPDEDHSTAPQQSQTAVGLDDERAAFEQAFQLVFEAYSAPRDRWAYDDGYILFLRGKVTTAFGLLQKVRAASPQATAAQPASDGASNEREIKTRFESATGDQA